MSRGRKRGGAAAAIVEDDLNLREVHDTGPGVQERSLKELERDLLGEEIPDTPTAAATEMPEPEPLLAPRLSSVEFTVVSVQDIDRLWDWIRTDGVDGIPGLASIESSLHLHAAMRVFTDAEQHGTAWFRAIDHDGAHAGFVTLYPIIGAQAGVHVFLDPAIRGHTDTLLGEVYARIRDAHPALQLAIMSQKQSVQRLASRHGFTERWYVALVPQEA